LSASRRNNRRVDVTGLLIVGGRRFLQVLEGPQEAVQQTLGRIAEDPRHFAIVELSNRAITTRSFSRWAMGFEEGRDVGEGLTLEAQIAGILEPVTDSNLKAYFEGFARSHSKVA
jgi:hypothetical protein